MNYNNKAYSVQRKYKGTIYYICNKKKVNKCPTRLIIKEDGSVIEKNKHICTSENINQAIDVREDMKAYVENECTKDLSVLPNTLWTQAIQHMNNINNNQPIITLTKKHTINHINYIRQQLHGDDYYRTIEQTPISNVSENDERKFL